jgi:hypothetical protein
MSESRFCARCGRELEADAHFCPNCGAPRAGGAAASGVLPSNARRFELFEVGRHQTDHSWIDFLMFRRMIIPILIRILFVVALIVCVLGFLVSLIQSNVGAALAFLVFWTTASADVLRADHPPVRDQRYARGPASHDDRAARHRAQPRRVTSLITDF